MTLGPVRGDPADDGKERLDIAFGEEGRGLVEHQNAAAASRLR